jgi:hypothetical protein
MSNEWRISKATIEAEMLRLAALLCNPTRSATAHAGLARHEAKAANASLGFAVRAAENC